MKCRMTLGYPFLRPTLGAGEYLGASNDSDARDVNYWTWITVYDPTCTGTSTLALEPYGRTVREGAIASEASDCVVC
jgi:hypothetical protein